MKSSVEQRFLDIHILPEELGRHVLAFSNLELLAPRSLQGNDDSVANLGPRQTMLAANAESAVEKCNFRQRRQS